MAMTFADVFMDVYFEGHGAWAPLRAVVNAIDRCSWRKLDTVFTKTATARDFLVGYGVSPDRIEVVPDPCDTFYPAPDTGHEPLIGHTWSSWHSARIDRNKRTDSVFRSFVLGVDARCQ